MSETPFIAAVRSGDVEAVTALLDAGADPDTADEHGTPALCLAVDTFALPVVEALTGAATLDRVTPDGRTALLRAIDRGACDITDELIARGANPRLKDAEGRDALALARYWHEMGAVAELRRRNGRSELVKRRTVHGEFGATCRELSLAGLTVRDGHTAILTRLEPMYWITLSFDELLSRAVAEPDTEHQVWLETTGVLWNRGGHAVWDAAASLRHRPDPLERCFGAEVLRLLDLVDDGNGRPFTEALVDLFVSWVAQESDPRVTRVLTMGLGNACHPRAEQSLLGLARHRDARVRSAAVDGLHSALWEGSSAARTAVVERTKDEDAVTRRTACEALALDPWSPTSSDALAACLADKDEGVRVEAAARLWQRFDDRGREVLDSLDCIGVDPAYHSLIEEVWRLRRATPYAPATGP
ncbi:hypothetical protein GCM10009799_30700 [Nocardiopsis rhodophaea]|uniref:Ankyrin repeat protein n=1 Tax=Nocardiopsis rhodophaea TaxID=280238 RepID=A0ABP5EPE7_9ACTN